jgi:putative oxidoreductase
MDHTKNMKSALTHTGRSLLALYFLLPGIAKFIQWDMHVTLMETHGMVMVPALLVIAGIIQIGASILLLFNKQVVLCALGLAAMVIVINFNLHDFWNVYEGVDAKHETQNFVKNMGIFAGLLLLAAANMTSIKESSKDK